MQYKPSYIHSFSILDFFIFIIFTRPNLKKGDPRLLHDVIVAGASALKKTNKETDSITITEKVMEHSNGCVPSCELLRRQVV